MEFETFYDELKEINGTLRVTIPFKLANFMGVKAGDSVKIMIKKIDEKSEIY